MQVEKRIVDGSEVAVVEISPLDYATLEPSDVIELCVANGAINDEGGVRTYRVHDPFFTAAYNDNPPDLTADELGQLFEA